MWIEEQVKRALGIYYSDPDTDAFIGELIDQSKDDLTASGVPANLLDTPLAHRAIVMFCKGAYPTEDAKDLTVTPAYISIVTKLRS